MSLEKELEVYRRERSGWIKAGWLGQWVVVKDEDVLGPYPKVEDAVEAAYDRYGLDAVFLTRQVAEHDRVIITSRRTVRVPRDG